MDANVKMYRASVEKGEITITIYHEKCMIKNSNEENNYEVKINLNSNNTQTEFIGCGNYNADYRLYDLWVLEELNNEKISDSNFSKELPLLEINSSSKSFSGFSGCNRFTGKLFQERELLRFINIVSTKIACQKENLEQTFIKALKSSTSYEIKNNRLYLSNPSGTIVVLKKVD